ncbi:MAG TPA: type III secretion system chaperone [Ramlibacter sp.]|uniref:type III secretion system chaperone n=1 Tax=Ramlibacter sp. TaxID=1917967 RepID=UPI002CAE6EE4|nr:type III secretion system chaperone [Ramlibacter sp.]HVZ42972.1 type III secretion system chaperone [Ramlibacter sp.]
MALHRTSHGNDATVVNQWLDAFGRRTGLALRLDDEGVCSIGHACGLDCVIESPGNGSVYLSVAILPWEPEAHPDLAERCLVAQFMGRGTHGASFGVDPIDAQLVVWQERPIVTLDAAGFAHAVMQLLETAVHWRSGLPAAEEEAERAAAIDAERPAHFNMLRA